METGKWKLEAGSRKLANRKEKLEDGSSFVCLRLGNGNPPAWF
jgi:hypothetical protein